MTQADAFYIEPVDSNQWQSVFPERLAEYSQLHSSVSDAIAYIREVAGDVPIHEMLTDTAYGESEAEQARRGR